LPVLYISLITILSVVVIHHFFTDSNSDVLEDSHISNRNDEVVEIKVLFTSDYVIRSTSVVVDVDVISLKQEDTFEVCRGKIRVYLGKYPRFNIGERLVIKGKLEAPKDFDSDFSYKEYLSLKGIYSVMYYPGVYSTGEYEINPFMKTLFAVREDVIGKINKYLPEPHSSLLSGILLGVKNAMPEGFSDSLQRTGTTHIIAASGYNVTLVASFLIRILSFLHRKLRIVVAIAFVWVFVIISGGSIPVVRAAIMTSVSLIALLFGRCADVGQSLVFSVAVMFLMDSNVYLDISFQLSFASTVGLIYFVPIIKKACSFIPDSLEDSVVVTFAAILSTFPITAVNFKTLSLISPLANFLVLPVIGIVMILGSVFIVVPGFIKPLLSMISMIIWVPLDYFIKVVDFLSKLEFASIELSFFPFVIGLVYYFALVLIIIKCSKTVKYEES